MTRYLPLVAALSAIGFMNCSSVGNCTTANCGGCCDSDGQCITNPTADKCGRLGAACSACTGATNVCVGGTCSAGMTGGGAGGGTGGGTGGGSGGGSTGGGSGGGGGCRAADFSQAQSLQASYDEPAMGDPNHFGAVGTPNGTKFDFMLFEGWYFGNNLTPTFPKTVSLPSPTGASYFQCYDCLVVREGCDITGNNCAAFYYVQGGSMTITTATRNVAAGSFVATASNLNFVEWDLSEVGDRAIPNGRCLTVANVSLNASWPADAGVTMDAGFDAGVADAGTDAGTVVDAGIDAGIDAGVDAGP